MNKLITPGILAVGAIAGAYILAIEADHDHDDHSHVGGGTAVVDEEFERGPHNGRLLRDGDIAVEITIFEDGVPPEYRVYAYRNDKPLPPGDVDLTVELGRLGGITDRFTFAPESDYLRGSGVVVEPHSFEVKVSATVGGKALSRSYDSYEGRVEIAAAAAETNGVGTSVAGPAAIREIVPAMGRIIADPTRSARITARFPGVIRELHATLGATVKKGDAIAVVESNDSLQTYTIRSPIDGTVIAQHATVGESVGDGVIVEVADLGRLFAEFHVFPRDAAKLSVGQPARVSAVDSDQAIEAVVGVIMPTVDPVSQSVPVRVPIEGAGGRWRVGAMVEGRITVKARDVPLAVKMSGLQSFRDFTVVYAQFGETYEVRMLELGADDGEFIEVLGGIGPGVTYVSENSFLIKADVEKSGAAHDH